MRNLLGKLWLFLILLISPQLLGDPQPSSSKVYLLELIGGIGPATQDFVARGIDQAVSDKAQFVILSIDTPGGLEKSMRAIVARIIHSPIPVVTYVSPSGARAASAGTFVLYASHVAVMAPGTNVGAATPVSISGVGSSNKEMSSSEKKAINDASAYIRSLAQLRGRNVSWAEESVEKGVSISAEEALRLNVIDFIAADFQELLSKLNGKVIKIANNQITLETKHVVIKKLTPDWRIHFLAIITDPNIAYILLLIGIYGLIFEFMSPGFILPGVVGLISLLIALYAFQLLPVNYVGLALILIGVAFIIAEFFISSFGALGVGGIIAFIVGSVMLFDTKAPGFALLWPVIVAIALVTIGFLLLVAQLVVRAQRRPVVSGREELLGSEGDIILIKGNGGRPRIRIRGELWQVRSNVPLKEGQRVKVVDMDELILIVVPIGETQTEGKEI